jgi:hypothetical protein
VRIVILDQQRRVVADLGSYPSNGSVTSVFAEQARFVPEVHRLQVFRDDMGGTATWNGAGDGAVPMPNGYYRVQVQAPGGSEVEAEFYLEHQAWQAGDVHVSLVPGVQRLRIRWNYAEAVNLRFDLYNLAGELVWQERGQGAIGGLDWDLSAGSGRSIASGIYLLRSQASSLDGAVDDLRVFKLAVAR